ncbi:hypothetical protein MKI79_05435 [Acinetobacter sp. A3.8]|uniref:Uncharacterized protein n=1 Tax=Acinetobacter sedimenti TaxID=2919922 RepID=A0A9X1WZJ3_9GAMM|nr:hypothetical protein [Acinetobacter sedimenti]MCJ8146345.1 hypothetical protein [Acinetobacter sedimenti]
MGSASHNVDAKSVTKKTANGTKSVANKAKDKAIDAKSKVSNATAGSTNVGVNAEVNDHIGHQN